MKIIHIDKPITDSERAELCFQGDVLIYKNISAMHDLISYSDRLLRKGLNGIDPVIAQEFFNPEEFLYLTGEVQKHFRSSDTAKQLFFRAIEECGVDLDRTYYDHFPMRIVPYGDAYNGARCGLINHHRDTWGSNIYHQLNWWAPLYALEAERTIAVYPDYWSQGVKNSSDEWRFEKYIEERKKTLANNKHSSADESKIEREISYPSTPVLKEDIDETKVVKIMLAPGDILNLSSAHLHASVPNSTDRARYSIEMRSICMDDIEAERMAHNVDNAGVKPMYQWFRSIKTKCALDKVLCETHSQL